MVSALQKFYGTKKKQTILNTLKEINRIKRTRWTE